MKRLHLMLVQTSCPTNSASLCLNYPLRFWENCIQSFPSLTVFSKRISQGDCCSWNLPAALNGLKAFGHRRYHKLSPMWLQIPHLKIRYWSFTTWSSIFLREPNSEEVIFTRVFLQYVFGSILDALCMHVNTAERNLPLLSELLATVINSKQKCWSGDAGKGQTHMFTHRPVKEKG